MTLKGNKDIYLWGDEPGKTVIILLSGKAGVGKTTTARFMKYYLVENSYNTEIIPFADGIKRCAVQYFGWDGQKDIRGRRLLQRLGTEVGREYDENVWVKFLVRSVLADPIPKDFILVDDWRFPNELSYVENRAEFDVVKVRIESPERESLKGTPEENHISEISLPTAQDNENYYNFIVENVSTMGYLDRDATNIIRNILKKELK